MPDIDNDSPLPSRILYALEQNQHRRGLTVPEIKEVLGLGSTFNKRVSKKIYKAVSYLIKDRLVQYQSYPINPRMGFYSLLKTEQVLADLVESQKLPLTYVIPKLTPQKVTSKVENNNHPLLRESDISGILQGLLNEWNNVSTPRFFPPLPGLYAFYSEANARCLYIGQASNLLERGRYHWLWKEALNNLEKPYASYKIIECGHPDETKRELVYEESLLIGLLRPEWNSATPPPKHDIAPSNYKFEQLGTIHWTQLLDSCYEPYNSLMLTDEGYLVPKFIRVNVGLKKARKQWVNVLYDRDYAKEWVKDLCSQIDTFFVLTDSND